MVLKDSLLVNRRESIIISKTKLITGFVAGLLFAFWLYAFLYMGREVFRFFSRTEYYDLLILTRQEIFFYNLFFAFVAVIFGQSICFTYWFDKPGKLSQRHNWRRTSIVNDNKVLNWYFLSWFSKVSFAVALYFCFTIGGSHCGLNLFPEYIYLFILVVIVLYLQVWNTFRVHFRKESKKWFLVSLLLVPTVSLIFSMINFVDHKALDEGFLQKNVYVKYNLKIPESDFYRFGVERLSLTEKIFIVMTGDSDKPVSPHIIHEHQVISLDEIGGVANDWILSRHPAERSLIDVRLHIDKDVPMRFIHDFKEELSRHNIIRISYVVYPADREIEKGFHYYYAIPTFLSPPGADIGAVADSMIQSHKISNVINLRIDNSDEYFVNGQTVNKNNLREHLELQLKIDFNSAFVFTYTETTPYSEFVHGSGQIRKATQHIRDDLARKEYGVSFDELRFLPAYDDFTEKYSMFLFEYIEN